MKCFPFQWLASGKQGGAALGMGGYHAARTGSTGAALPSAGGTTLPGMRSATLPGTGLLSVTSRKGVPQSLLPALPDCQVAVLPSLPY